MMLSDVPNDLSSGPIVLRFEKIVRPEGNPEFVPFYHFKIVDESRNVVGHINLRIGETRHLRLCAGHVGYRILPAFRGSSFSLYACRALAPFVRRHHEKVLLTAEVGNASSISTIEKLGAQFLDEVDVPADDPGFVNGARRKRRYEWTP